jgi:hypothetical protein
MAAISYSFKIGPAHVSNMMEFVDFGNGCCAMHLEQGGLLERNAKGLCWLHHCLECLCMGANLRVDVQ